MLFYCAGTGDLAQATQASTPAEAGELCDQHDETAYYPLPGRDWPEPLHLKK